MARQTKASASVTRGKSPKVPTSVRVPDGINQRTVDSLENIITGLGTSSDKSTATRFIFNPMNQQQLEAAYRSDWVSRKVIDIPAQDATREWRSWQSDKKDITALEEVERTLLVPLKVQLAMRKARLYGGAAILIGVNQGSMSQELDPTKVTQDSLKFLHVVSRWELTAGEIDWDIDSDFYGLPSYYTRARGAAASQQGARIHPSRVVRFIGNEVPDPILGDGWGDPILQAIQDAIISAGLATAGGAQIMQELSLDVVSIPELSDNLSNKDYEERLTSRFAAANLMKSLYKVLLLDKDETWQRVTTSLAGIPEIVQAYLHVVSGAADIPATRLLGQSPKGLSATGASDTRNYYDLVKTEQETRVTPAMSVLDEVLIRSALGTGDPSSITYAWKSLWQLDEVQTATVAVQKSTVFKADVDAGLIPGEVLRDARINQLLEDETYPGLDQILDDYGPLDPIPEMMPGAVIGPDGQPINPGEPGHPLTAAPGAPGQPGAANSNDPNAPQPGATQPAGKGAAAPPSVGKNVARNGGRPSRDMASRIRDANPRAARWSYADATPRTLYVSRQVLNADEIYAWASGTGIENLVAPVDMHVTLIYSRTPVDWSKTGESWGSDADGGLTVRPGGMRMVDKFGTAIVLCFNSSDLAWRHCQLKDGGATWDYEDYQPHVTLSYDAEGLVDLAGIAAYQGVIRLGPEVYAEATRGDQLKDERPLEDFNEYHEPAGSPEGGRFSTGAAGGVPRVVAHVKGLQQKAKTFVQSNKVQKIIATVADHDNQKEALSRAIVFGMYHGASMDMGPDLEEAVRDQVHHLADNAKITAALARTKMRDTVEKIIASRAGRAIGAGPMVGAMRAFARADAMDWQLQALQKVKQVLDNDQVFAGDE